MVAQSKVERPHVVVLDLEIARPIDSDPDGWAAARRGDLGVSAVVIWDSLTDRPHVYDERTINAAMEHLNSADLIVGWNIQDFDIPCLEGFTETLVDVPQYDILQKVWESLGSRFLKGYKLGDVAQRTIDRKKSGNGESAPKLASLHRYAELFDYCINDVSITKELYNFILDNGYIVGTDGGQVQIEPPAETWWV